jgi:hypothetical protein
MPALINELMEAEYTPVDRWGDQQRDKKTTFRKELVKSVHEQMVYKKTNYASERNPFTKAVDAVISENVDSFKARFNNLVTETFTKETLNHAMTELRKKFGITG